MCRMLSGINKNKRFLLQRLELKVQRFNARVHIVIDKVSGVSSTHGTEVCSRVTQEDIIFHHDKVNRAAFAATCVFALANVICFYAP